MLPPHGVWVTEARINIQKPEDLPDCFLGVVPQPTGSRLNETIVSHNRLSVGCVTTPRRGGLKVLPPHGA